MRHPESDSFYDVLGVCPDATACEIRAAFLHLAQRFHPDLNADDPDADQRFKQIRRVYEILCDPIKRAAYDDHPHHFRLNDADIVRGDASPIVTRPADTGSSGSYWSSRHPSSAKADYRPRWLADSQLHFKRQLAFVGVMTAMVALVAACALVVHSRGRMIPGNHRTIAAEPMGRVAPPQEASAPRSDVSPLEQVISSVRDLRAKADTEGADTGADSTNDDARNQSASRPEFNIMDELNLPRPGWPLTLPRLNVPLINRSPSSSADEAYSLPPTPDRFMVRSVSGEPEWRPTPPLTTVHQPPATRPWESLNTEPLRHEVQPLSNELDMVRSRVTNSAFQTPQPNSPLPAPSYATSQHAAPVATGTWPQARSSVPAAVAGASPVISPVVQNLLRRVSANTSYAGRPLWPVSGFTNGHWSTPDEVETSPGAGGDEYVPRSAFGWPGAAPPSSSATQPTTGPARLMPAGVLPTGAMGPSSSMPRHFSSFPSRPVSGFPDSAHPYPR